MLSQIYYKYLLLFTVFAIIKRKCHIIFSFLDIYNIIDFSRTWSVINTNEKCQINYNIYICIFYRLFFSQRLEFSSLILALGANTREKLKINKISNLVHKFL